MSSREELIRRAWDLAEFDLVTDSQSQLYSAVPSELYEGLGDLDVLPKTDRQSPNKKVTYIPYKKPEPGHPPPSPTHPDPQHAQGHSSEPSASTYTSVHDRVGAIIDRAVDRITESLADLGLALVRRDAAESRGTPHPRLVSTVHESDDSFRPRPGLWDILEDGPQSARDPMGDWPARLLHIPSMTSLEWRPGNFYGAHREPPYAVLSYTWGRWELRCAHAPRCPALGVRGLDWEVPAVCPRLFTVAMFENVLGSVAGQAGLDFVWVDVVCIDQRPGSRDKAREIGRQAKIFGNARQAFIWLLDPRDPSPGPCCGISPMCGDGCLVPAGLGSAAGQAQSGGGPGTAGQPPQKWHASNEKVDAQVVLRRLERTSQALERAHQAWLSDHTYMASGSSATAELAEPQQQQQEESSSEDLHNAATAAGAIALLTSVPWFSSTWTLQEAFIQPAAVFLDREGDCCFPASGAGAGAGAPFSLHDLLTCCRSIHRLYAVSTNPLATRGDRDAHVVMKRGSVLAIERTGLQALADRDRMTLYACAQLRHARNRNDWVYGIMQVWGFQLGESAAAAGDGDDGASPAPRTWTLEDLELELGRALLRDFPVESQLQVHATAPAGRQAWRVSAHSATPLHPLSFAPSGHLAGVVDRGAARLGVRRAPDGVVYGHFRGRSCAYETLRRAWASAAVGREAGGGTGGGSERATTSDGAGPFYISLDRTHVLNSTDLMLPYSLRDVPNEKQAEVADTIGAVFRRLGRTVSVLHLATVTQPPRGGGTSAGAGVGADRTTGIGLIVMNCPDQVVGGWRKRLGVCLWDVNLPHSSDLDQAGRRQVSDVLSVASSTWVEDECIFG